MLLGSIDLVRDSRAHSIKYIQQLLALKKCFSIFVKPEATKKS